MTTPDSSTFFKKENRTLMSGLAGLIDHTLLKSNIDKQQINDLCADAIENEFAAVCIPPYYVNVAAALLQDSKIKVATVIGFPMGYATVFAKVEEIKRAIQDGADEIDAVLNISAVKDGSWNYVTNEIQSFTRAAHLKGKILKLIIEAAVLTDEQIQKVCEIANAEKVDYIKTSTGYNGGATAEMVTQIKKYLDSSIKIKASGGIRTKAQAISLIDAGAQRIGTSASIDII